MNDIPKENAFKETVKDAVNKIEDKEIEETIGKYDAFLNKNIKDRCTVEEVKDIIKDEKTIEEMAKNQTEISEEAAQEIVSKKIDEIVRKKIERLRLFHAVKETINAKENMAIRKISEQTLTDNNLSEILKKNNFKDDVEDLEKGVNVYLLSDSMFKLLFNAVNKNAGINNFTLNFNKKTEQYVFTCYLDNISIESPDIKTVIEKINIAFERIYRKGKEKRKEIIPSIDTSKILVSSVNAPGK